jgi:hypothetical protein
LGQIEGAIRAGRRREKEGDREHDGGSCHATHGVTAVQSECHSTPGLAARSRPGAHEGLEHRPVTSAFRSPLVGGPSSSSGESVEHPPLAA